MRVKEAGHFLHVQNHDLLKFIIRQWYTFNKNFEYQNEERHLIYSLTVDAKLKFPFRIRRTLVVLSVT